MKKLIIFLVTLGLFAGFSSTAQAGYSINIGYSTCRTHGGHDVYYPYSYRHYHRDHYQHHYLYYPDYPVVVEKTVVYEHVKQAGNDQERFGISDVIILSKAGINDDTIIDKIRNTGSVFDLSVEEVEALRKEGVSARVVNYMLNT